MDTVAVHNIDAGKRRLTHIGRVAVNMRYAKERAMRTLTRWNPFQELEEVTNRLNRFYGDRDAMIMESDWAPPVEFVETPADYIIKAELPEIEKKDVKVTVEDGVLLIKGERMKEIEAKDKKLHRVERFHGRFMRSFNLPENVEPNKVQAKFENGLLKVILHKTDKPAAEAIDISLS
jgi:HSP20 family protein